MMQIALSVTGVVISLLTLMVTSSMMSKTSTAVHMSILMLYNIIRLLAAGFLGIFSLVNSRQSVQKVSNFMWLLGTWGVNFTMVDLAVEHVLMAVRPDIAQVFVTAINAVKKTLLILALGLSANAMALVHAIVTKQSTTRNMKKAGCEEPAFYYAYNRAYSLHAVTVLHFLVPTTIMLVAAFLMIAVCIRARLQAEAMYERYTSNPSVFHVVRSYRAQRACVLCITFIQLGANAVYCLGLLRLMGTKAKDVRTEQRDRFILHFQLAELCIMASTILTPIFLFLWSSCRRQSKRTVPCTCWETPLPITSATSSRSAHSITTFSTL